MPTSAEDRRDRIANVDQAYRAERPAHIPLSGECDSRCSRVFVALAARVPMALVRIDVKSGRVLVVVITCLVKDEKLGLGTDIDRVGDAGKFQIALGTLSRPNADRANSLLW